MAGRFGGLLAGGGRMERWGQPLRIIAMDYVEVTKDAYKGIKTKPVKSLAYTLVGGAFIATWRMRPDADSYTDRLLDHCNEFHLCSQMVRKEETARYLDDKVSRLSTNELQYKSFGLFAVMLEREGSPGCQNYHVTCKYVRRRWWERWSRVVDFGFWGKWWALDRAMLDYDVNEEELADWLEKQKKF